MDNTEITISRFFCFVMSISYLFGQVYFGSFGFLETVVGLSGLLVTAMSGKFVEKGLINSALVISGSVVVLIGLLYFVVDYYTEEQLPGSYFPDTLTFLFALSVLVLVTKAITNLRKSLNVC